MVWNGDSGWKLYEQVRQRSQQCSLQWASNSFFFLPFLLMTGPKLRDGCYTSGADGCPKHRSGTCSSSANGEWLYHEEPLAKAADHQTAAAAGGSWPFCDGFMGLLFKWCGLSDVCRILACFSQGSLHGSRLPISPLRQPCKVRLGWKSATSPSLPSKHHSWMGI